jgi:hypothetical protein
MRKFLILLSFTIASIVATAQLKNLGEKLLKGKDPLGMKKPPITTSLDDVKMEGALDANFANDTTFKSMITLQRTPNGGFALLPGFYRYQSQSYCLKAGTHGPGGGDGYMYAATEGPMDDIVMAIVRNSVNHPELDQHDIQVLLWAIIARSKVDDLQNKIKLVAATLLTPKQIVKLNGGALGLVPDKVKNDAIASAPNGIRQVLEAEASLRQMLTSPSATYADMERIAVLTGMAPLGDDSRVVPSGRWSLHPDGYYVRYVPSSYSSTRVEIWVPQGSPGVGKEFDPATHIAVPGNTARQRLIQSGRVKEN